MSAASSSSPGDVRRLLPPVIGLAREAGARILAHYGTAAAVSVKADASPLTEADREAHRVIADGLAALDPPTPVISEEAAAPDYAARRAWTRFWLVDPLDGTKEFLSRNGEFTVNIALIDGGCPTLGVIYAPALSLLYYATAGGGAWKQPDGEVPRRIFSRDRNGSGARAPVTIVESRSHPSAELEHFLRSLTVRERIRIGSSLKFCLLAEGRADVYPRLGPTMEWDVAAGDCIYRSAGRTGPNPSPLTYNKPDLRNAGFVLGV